MNNANIIEGIAVAFSIVFVFFAPVYAAWWMGFAIWIHLKRKDEL